MPEPTASSSSQRYIVLIVLLLLAAVILSSALVWWARGKIRQRWMEEQQAFEVEYVEPPPPRSRDFVGSDSCRECHAEIAEHYAAHPKSFSLSHVAADSGPQIHGEASRFAPLPERQYEVRADGDEVKHHELGFDAEGELIYDQGLAVDYAIGSGHRLKSYIMDRNGHLFLSPISWYEEQANWGLSVGYERFPHPRFENPVSERCIHCHTGQYAVTDRNSTTATPRFEQPPFQESAISCERCHGPGGDHVRFRRGQANDMTEDPIVSLSSLGAAQRDSVCNQCHIQGQHHFLRLGRRHDDFRPGDHLGEIWSIFVGGVDPENPPHFSDISPAEQMQSSRCYVASDRQLGCTSCHDPHQAPDRSDLAGYYRQRCMNCHTDESCSLPLPRQQAAPAEGSCIACHMPTRDDVPILHSTRTDHRLRKDPSVAPELARGDSARLPRIFDLADHPLSTAEEARARGLVLTELAIPGRSREYATQAEALLARTIDATQGDVRTINALAIVFALLGRNKESIEILNATTNLDPTRLETWYELLLANQATGEMEAARRPAEQLVRLNPWYSEWHGRHAQILASVGQPEAALQAAARALELDPSSTPTWALLAQLHDAMGNREKAAEAQRMLDRLRGE
jgi:predicted CXXCH cytochrome family protein